MNYNLNFQKKKNRISASNAISAPLTWQQGDLRRPYPTDIEMRLGFLGKSDVTNVNGHSSQIPSTTPVDFPKSTIGGIVYLVKLLSFNELIHTQNSKFNVFNRYSIGFPKSICLDAIGRITHDGRKEFNGYRST